MEGRATFGKLKAAQAHGALWSEPTFYCYRFVCTGKHKWRGAGLSSLLIERADVNDNTAVAQTPACGPISLSES